MDVVLRCGPVVLDQNLTLPGEASILGSDVARLRPREGLPRRHLHHERRTRRASEVAETSERASRSVLGRRRPIDDLTYAEGTSLRPFCGCATQGHGRQAV